MRAGVRLQRPVMRKQDTMSSLPAVSVHERSPYMNLFSYNFRRPTLARSRSRPIPDRIRHAIRNDQRHQDQLSRTGQGPLSADVRARRLALRDLALDRRGRQGGVRADGRARDAVAPLHLHRLRPPRMRPLGRPRRASSLGFVRRGSQGTARPGGRETGVHPGQLHGRIARARFRGAPARGMQGPPAALARRRVPVDAEGARVLPAPRGLRARERPRGGDRARAARREFLARPRDRALGIARRGLSGVRARAREGECGPVSRYLRTQPGRDLQRHHALGRKRRGTDADRDSGPHHVGRGQPAHAIGVLGFEGAYAAIGAVGGHAAAPDGAEHARADPAVQIAVRDIGASRLKPAAKVFNRLPGLARFILALTAINLAVFAAFRGAFWAVFHEALASASWADLLKALTLGFKFDLRLALLICVPLALLGWIPLFDPARRRAARIAWLGYLALAQCVVLLLYFVAFGHYAYARVRLNASLIDHLTPVGVAARVAWETYPVVLCVLGLALLASAYLWIVRSAARQMLVAAGPPLGKWPKRAAIGALAALYALGIYGKWSRYPLRWSEAYFSSSEAVAALALNPVLFLMDTAENRNLPYDTDKVREHYAYTAALLGIASPDPQKLDFARYVAPPAKPAIRYNLVVIHLESF